MINAWWLMHMMNEYADGWALSGSFSRRHFHSIHFHVIIHSCTFMIHQSCIHDLHSWCVHVQVRVHHEWWRENQMNERENADEWWSRCNADEWWTRKCNEERENAESADSHQPWAQKASSDFESWIVARTRSFQIKNSLDISRLVSIFVFNKLSWE